MNVTTIEYLITNHYAPEAWQSVSIPHVGPAVVCHANGVETLNRTDAILAIEWCTARPETYVVEVVH